MALVTRGAAADLEPTSSLTSPQVPGSILEAGENLDKVAPCYIAAADGKVYMADGTAANEKARLAGFTADEYLAGEKVSLWGIGTIFQYDEAEGLTPGARLYIAATPGRLDNAATTGDATGVAQAINNRLIRVTRAI